jgi:hypothetical protein
MEEPTIVPSAPSGTAAAAPPAATIPPAPTLAEAAAGPAQEPSIVLGIAGGLAAMVVSAAVWGAITYLTDFQIGWMAIGVGIVVGLAVRFFGGGRSVTFGVIGAVLALLGVVLGNLVFFTGAIAREEGLGFLEVFGVLLANPDVTAQIFVETFELIDALFYGLAIYAGFRTAFARPR